MLGLITSDWRKLKAWQSDPAALSTSDWERISSAGVAAFHPAVHLPSRDPARSMDRWFAGWRRFCELHPDRFAVVRRASDLERFRAEGRIGIVIGSQNSTHFQTTGDVQKFADAGQRVAQLTYNAANRLGGGCYAPDRGLTAFGVEIIAAMNRAGMVIDVSHCGERTTLDAIAASRRPVVVSHSNCLTLNPGESRCKSDGVLRALADSGGVLGVSMIRKFVRRSGPASLESLLDHFDHAIRLMGAEHVGLGSDADLEGRQPVLRDLADHQYVFRIASGLRRRGYSDPVVAQVLGGNFRRIFRASDTA